MTNIAIVGCGYWGPNLIRVFSQSEKAHLHTCCDLDESKLKKIKSIYPYVNITKDYNDILNNPEIDAVIIATPVYSHFELAKKALQANKHVLLEKPMTSTSKESEQLIKLSKEKNKVLMVDHTFEFNPAIKKMKEIVESGELGSIYYINANWLNLGLLQPDVNVVFDLATHVFSIINHITGHNPISVRATGEAYIRESIEETANLMIKYPNKIRANINVSWLEPCKQRTMTIVGSKKMLSFDLLNPQEQIKIYDMGVDINNLENKISYRAGDIHSPKVKIIEPLKEEADHFIDCIQNNKKPLTHGENGLSVVKLLEAVHYSLKNNGVEVKL